MAVSIRPQFSVPSADPGEWHVFMTDPETGEQSRLRLRPLTDVEEQGIAASVNGMTVKLRAAGGAVEQDWNGQKFRLQNRVRAGRALLATENVAVTPADAEMAKAYAAFAPGMTVEVGQPLVIDGLLDARAVAKIDEGTTESGEPRRVTREMSLREFFLAGPDAGWICDWIMAAVAERASEKRAAELGKART